jgi:AraC-like DNA-binding protein
MSAPVPTVEEVADTYVFSPGVLPGAVGSTVGYHAEGLTPQLHRGLPSPYLTFILSLGQPIVTGATPSQAWGDTARRTEILVAGLHDAPAYVVQPEVQSGIQLAVHPLAAHSIFGTPASRLPAEAISGADVLGPEVERLRQRLLEPSSWSQRFDLVAHYLRRRVDARGRRRARPEVVAAWSWLTRRQGACSIAELAGHVGVSPRHLRALFGAEVGISPKQVAALMRFDATKQDIARAVVDGGPLRLTELAHRRGFYDHAHLDAEFRRFAGTSPTGWVAEELRNIQAGGHQGGVE